MLLALTLVPYQWNATALFHMDHLLGDQVDLPSDFVVLGVPSYDGAQYYQVARNIPLLFNPLRWNDLTVRSPGPYAYQRILLPLVAFTLALGMDDALPYAFLFINVIALVVSCALFLSWKRRPLAALALALSPAATVALHFNLAEPLTLLLILIVLLRLESRGYLRAFDLVLLSFAVLTREVNILFVCFLVAAAIVRREPREAALLTIPVIVFLAWHAMIYHIFGAVPFLWSTAKSTLPFGAMLPLIVGVDGFNRFTLSSISLALFVVIPGLFWTGYLLLRRKDRSLSTWGSFCFLLLMTTMPDHIWGSITSIGRVITPVYPLLLVTCAKRDDLGSRCIAVTILLIGLGAGLALSQSAHPFSLAS